MAEAAAGHLVLIAGASSDAGRATAAALGTAGALVVAVGSNAERLADVPATARYVCNLLDAAAVAELAERVRAEHGPVDGLLHLVGGWRAGQADDDWDWLNGRIVTTLRNTTLAFRDDLLASAAGRLAIVSSTAVDRPTWGNANYAVAKAAAEAWVSALAVGWAKVGTAAALSFVVRSLGEKDGDTSVAVLAAEFVRLWDAPATELNGARIHLPVLAPSQERLDP